MPDYGYLHLARVLRQDEASGGWMLQSVGLARTSTWGPVPSCVPGLGRGDRVILGSTGTSRDNLVILGKVGAGLLNIDGVEGLLEALAGKASVVDLNGLGDVVAGLGESGDALAGRMDAVEEVNDAQDLLLSEHATSIDALDDLTAAHTTQLTTLTNDGLYSKGNDYHVNNDIISTIPRWAAVGTMATPNNRAIYARMYTRRNIKVNIIRLVYSATDAPLAGSTAIRLYAGTNMAALPTVFSGTDGLGPHRVDVFPPGGVDIPAGSHIVVGILPLGMGGAETLKIGCSAVPVSVTLTNQDSGSLTTVGKNGQVALQTTLKMDSTADWDILYSSRPWVALAGVPY